MKRLTKRLILTGVFIGVASSAGMIWTHHQINKVPDFYKEAISSSKASSDAVVLDSQRMQSRVEKLQSDVERVGIWEADFAEEQINAWLIDQLPKYFANLQAKGLQGAPSQSRRRKLDRRSSDQQSTIPRCHFV